MDPFTHGRSRWPSRPGEISLALFAGIRLSLGSKLTVTSAPGQPKLTVVGYGDQNVFYDDAWVVPSQIAALRAKGAPPRTRCSISSPTRPPPHRSTPTWRS